MPSSGPVRTALLWLLALFMIGAGIMHFASPDMYVALIPPSWPARLFAVYASGVAELGLGVLLLVPRWRRLAAWGVIALLVAVYPANIYHAVSGGLSDPALPAMFESATAAYVRLPLQAVFIAWAWLFTRRPPEPPA